MVMQSPAAFLQNSSAHSAALFRQAFGSMRSQAGVAHTGDYAVTAQSTPNMSVLVAAGEAWIKGTQVANVAGTTWSTQSGYFALNDAPVTLTIATADPTNPRIDVVYVAVQDSFYSGATNTPVLGVVTGTPAPSPVAPAVPANALALAQVSVVANATSITSARITSVSVPMLLAGSPLVCTSTTRPAGAQLGQVIYETDTGDERILTSTNPTTWTLVYDPTQTANGTRLLKKDQTGTAAPTSTTPVVLSGIDGSTVTLTSQRALTVLLHAQTIQGNTGGELGRVTLTTTDSASTQIVRRSQTFNTNSGTAGEVSACVVLSGTFPAGTVTFNANALRVIGGSQVSVSNSELVVLDGGPA